MQTQYRTLTLAELLTLAEWSDDPLVRELADRLDAMAFMNTLYPDSTQPKQLNLFKEN